MEIGDERGGMRILSIGGGPGGLYLAILARLADPSAEVVVRERNQADDTFGFGVVFSDRTLATLRDHDAETFDALSRALVRWDTIHVRHGGRALESRGHGFSAIARAELLALLQRRAEEVGAQLSFADECDVDRLDELAGEYDVVVGADGVASGVRERRAAAFAPQVDEGAARFIWLGTDRVYDSFYFAFERNEHGTFASHAYPFAADRSTFIVETDEGSWRAAGMHEHAARAAAPGANDAYAHAYLQDLFADHLAGGWLLVNNSSWRTFPTLRCRRWSDGNVVLIGDAAHTAHFSVGSGTKMAMEDAAALVGALQRRGDVFGALAAYEAERRPDVERIQEASRPSLHWWEHFGRYMDMTPERFTIHFLTRNPDMTLERMRRRDAALVEEVATNLLDGQGAGPAHERPLRLRGLHLPRRAVVVGGTQAEGAGLVLGENAPHGVARGAVVETVEGACVAVSEGAVLVVLQATQERLGDLVAATRGVLPDEAPLGVQPQHDDDEDALVDRAARWRADGADLLVLGPGQGERADWAVLERSVRLRLRTGLPTLVLAAATDADELETIVLSGRADLVGLAASAPTQETDAIDSGRVAVAS